MSQNLETNSFLSGPITVPLVKFTIPLILAMLFQALYGAIDMVIVGQLATAADVSAVGTGSLMMQAITAVIIGLTMGLTVKIGYYIGAKDSAGASNVFGGGVKLFAVFTLLATVFMIVYAPPFARIMSAPVEAFDKTVSYVSVCSVGIVAIVAYNFISGIFRGIGDSKSPLLFVGVACVCNVIGDLIFVGCFKLGATGAAWATVIAQTISVLFSLFYIRNRKLPFVLSWNSVKQSSGAVWELLKVGFPIATQDFLNYISFMILFSIINSLGLLASVAMSIEGKVFSFMVLIPISFMSALSAFVSQNIGSKQEYRAIQALHRGIIIAFSIGLCAFIMTFFFGDFIVKIFNSNPSVVTATSRMLRGASFEHLFFAIVFCLLGYFNGKSLTNFVLLQGIVCSLIVRIPIAYYISLSENVDMLWIGGSLSISSAVALVISVTYFFVQRKKILC